MVRPSNGRPGALRRALGPSGPRDLEVVIEIAVPLGDPYTDIPSPIVPLDVVWLAGVP